MSLIELSFKFLTVSEVSRGILEFILVIWIFDIISVPTYVGLINLSSLALIM